MSILSSPRIFHCFGRRRTNLIRRPGRVALGALVFAPALVVAFLVAFDRSVGSRFRVHNRSMLPTLRPGDHVLVNRIAFSLRRPRRGELVIFRHTRMGEVDAIKRVIGLPGERLTLEADSLWVDGQPLAEPYLSKARSGLSRHDWVLGRNEYVLLGDNRAESRDSRHFGPVPGGRLAGCAWYRYAPMWSRGTIRNF